jgi:chemotaxis response regulator CheB
VSVREIIVVGASAGGVEPSRVLAAGLPADLSSAVPVVLHVPRGAPRALPAILVADRAWKPGNPRAETRHHAVYRGNTSA